MGNLENIFEKRLKELGLKKQVDASLIVAEAQEKLNEIFGRNVEDSLKVISFTKGTLKIAAKSSAWANECRGNFGQIQTDSIKKITYVSLKEVE